VELLKTRSSGGLRNRKKCPLADFVWSDKSLGGCLKKTKSSFSVPFESRCSKLSSEYLGIEGRRRKGVKTHKNALNCMKNASKSATSLSLPMFKFLG